VGLGGLFLFWEDDELYENEEHEDECPLLFMGFIIFVI